MAIKRKSSRSRLVLAIALIVASFISAYIFSVLANEKTRMLASTTFLLPGHQIVESDLTSIEVSLGEVADNYIHDSSLLLGAFTNARIEAHELFPRSSIVSQFDALPLSSVPLSIRSADVPDGIIPGASIDIYWVQNDSNVEMQLTPELVVAGANVLAISKSGSNFGSEIALTVSIKSEDVLLLLAATSQGRVVLVSSRG